MRDPGNEVGEGQLLIRFFRQGSPPTRGTRLGGIAFNHVNGSCRAIPGSGRQIKRENMAARGEFFRGCHLPVLSSEQNDSQDQCNRRVSGG